MRAKGSQVHKIVLRFTITIYIYLKFILKVHDINFSTKIMLVTASVTNLHAAWVFAVAVMVC